MNHHPFVVEGIGPDLACTTLHVTASSAEVACALAQSAGVQVVQVRRDLRAEFKARLAARPFPAALFFREMALLLRAGLTLNTALTSLREKEKHPSSARVLDQIIEAVSHGSSFSAALARHPGAFSAVACSSIEAAAGAGGLADVLDRLAQYLEQGEQLRRRVVGALLYPSLVVVVGALVTAYLMFFVVPKFAEVYRDLGPSMPWIARGLVVWAELLHAHAWAVFAVVSVPLLLLTYVAMNQSARQWWLNRFQSLSAVKARYLLYQTVQFYQGLVVLMSSGATLPHALATLSGNVGVMNRGFQNRIDHARQAIESGIAVSDALYGAGLASTVSVRLIAAGEKSGAMVQSMTRIAQMHEADLTRDMEWLLKVLEPLLMLSVGLVVGGVVLLLYLPIFELANALG